MGADLGVRPVELPHFWRGCSGSTLDLKIPIKTSLQAHARTYLKHIALGGAPINFIQPKSLDNVRI